MTFQSHNWTAHLQNIELISVTTLHCMPIILPKVEKIVLDDERKYDSLETDLNKGVISKSYAYFLFIRESSFECVEKNKEISK